jgi:hypothetical protein
MAQPEFMMSGPVGVAGRKPKTSIYTMLLVISLIALLFGCLMLWLEIKQLEGTFGSVKGSLSTNAAPTRILVVADGVNLGGAAEATAYAGVPPAASAAPACRAPNSRSRSSKAAGSSLTI